MTNRDILKSIHCYCPIHFGLHGRWLTNAYDMKVRKGAKIRNRYNQAPHMTQDTNGKVTDSQLDTTNESQEVNLFPAGDHTAHINGRAQRLANRKTEKT